MINGGGKQGIAQLLETNKVQRIPTMVNKRQGEFLVLFSGQPTDLLAPTVHNTRENDLYQSKFPTMRRQLRFILARRSFAIEFSTAVGWKRVEDLQQKKTRKLGQQLNRFIKEKKLKYTTRRHILAGIKMLLLERCANVETISVLGMLNTSIFQDTPYGKIACLAKELLSIAFQWNTRANLEWYGACIIYYGYTVSQ